MSALRGNEEVVEFLALDCGADVSKRDKNGLTALELCVKKAQIKTEWALRRATTRSTIELIGTLGTQRLKEGRVMGFLCFGSNEREVSVWPWRIVFLSNLVASITTIIFALSEPLADLYVLHLLNTMFQCVWWGMFTACLVKGASDVRDASLPSGASSYEAALDTIGRMGTDEHLPAVCHTCRVVKPLRSKHCKLQRKCIHKFDHFCPFVGNTVSRDNYKYFIGLLCTHMVCGILWEVTAIYLARRVTISWCLFLYMIYAFLWMFMIGGLLQYHIGLITKNLTTNEHINMGKYSYLRNSYSQPDNPFDKGSPVANILDGLFPSSKSYFSREDVIRDKNGNISSSSNNFDTEEKSNLLV